MKNVIREMRNEKGLRQEDLGDLIGVSRQTINAIEKGKYDPSLNTAFRLAKVMGKRIEDLFQFED